MNIFRLDNDPVLAAQYHIDCYLNKLLLEAVQILSTAIRINQPDIQDNLLYKSTHIHHPCVKACAASRDIFIYTVNLANALNDERKIRYNYTHNHKSWYIAQHCKKYINLIPYNEISWPLAMPDKYKHNNPVTAYREYLIHEKMYNKSGKFMMYYTNREIPYWIPDNLKKIIIQKTNDQRT